MALHQYYALPGINPEQWAIGPLSVTNRGGTKRPFVGPNQSLLTYQKAVQTELERQGVTKLVDRECELTFYFWRRLDRYATAAGRGHARHVADATNMQKALEDALQGTLITNDRLVRRISSEVVEQSPDTHPGIIICLKSPYQPTGMLGVPGDMIRSFHDNRASSDEFDLSDNLL